jgi:predicted nucleic acid-binding protein
MEYGRPRVFIDADAFIAGSASTSGASQMILRLSELGLIEGVSSAQVRSEVERNLERMLPAALPVFRLLADAACRWVEDPVPDELAAVQGQADEKDVPILAAAVAAGCEWLVTFNVKDFYPRSGNIRVVRPGEFIATLRRLLEEMAEQE